MRIKIPVPSAKQKTHGQRTHQNERASPLRAPLDETRRVHESYARVGRSLVPRRTRAEFDRIREASKGAHIKADLLDHAQVCILPSSTEASRQTLGKRALSDCGLLMEHGTKRQATGALPPHNPVHARVVPAH